MQRPLHARFLKGDASLPNRQPDIPYIHSVPIGQLPASSPVDQRRNGGHAYYYPDGATGPAYIPVSSSSASGSPDRVRRRPTVPPASRAHTRTMSEWHRKVYDAPITYGTSQNQTSPTRAKSKRRVSGPERPLLGGETRPPERDSLPDPGAGQNPQRILESLDLISLFKVTSSCHCHLQTC